jgi:hypothetical protein
MSTIKLLNALQARHGRVISKVHNGLAIIGLVAVLFMLVQGGRLLPPTGPGATSAFGMIRYDGALPPTSSADADNPRYRVLAKYLSRRYRVANDATEQLVEAAHDAGQHVGLDPLLILSVMAIESRFNPIAQSDMGAKGLMQVMPQQHQDKIAEHGGEDAVLDPTTNIRIGARILKDCIRRAGNLESGLQLYAGALSDLTNQYAQKIMAEKDRLAQALRRTDRQPTRAANVAAAPGSAT